MNASDRLKELYKQADALSRDIPADMAKKIFLYTQALGIIGKFHADAVKDAGLAEADRKRIYSETIVNSTGTATDKAAKAEISCHEARRKEAAANGEMIRWKNAYQSTIEVINELKLELKSLMQEYGNQNAG